MDDVKPEARGFAVGTVTYRCAACGELIDGEAVFDPPLPLTPETKTYHLEHLPDGR